MPNGDTPRAHSPVQRRTRAQFHLKTQPPVDVFDGEVRTLLDSPSATGPPVDPPVDQSNYTHISGLSVPLHEPIFVCVMAAILFCVFMYPGVFYAIDSAFGGPVWPPPPPPTHWSARFSL